MKRKLWVALHKDDIYARAMQGATAVAVDVLRATSAMIYACANGAQRLWAFSTVDEARSKARQLPLGRAILGGERNSDPIEGFDLGNSPQDYTAERVAGKDVFITTTNGTAAIAWARKSTSDILLASLANAGAVAEVLRRKPGDVVCVLAGTNSAFTAEDAFCAGLVSSRLNEFDKDDSALLCEVFYRHNAKHPLEVLRASAGGRNLTAKGYDADVAFASRIDTTTCVPAFMDGYFTCAERAKMEQPK